MVFKIEQILQQAVSFHRQGNIQKAERLYLDMLDIKPEHPDANHNLGLISVSRGQSALAIPLFKVALNSNPKIEQFWISYVGALFKENQIKEAERVIKKAKKKGIDSEKLASLNPSKSAIHPKKEPSQAELNTLLQLHIAQQNDSTEELALKLTRDFPGHPFAWKVLGALLIGTGRIGQALKPNQRSVLLSPQDAEAHSNLGIVLHELGQFNEAADSYKQAISLRPDHAPSYFGLGNTLMQLSRYEEAIAHYKEGLMLEPDYAQGYFNLGNAQMETGQLNQAEYSYRQAITLKPNYIEAYINLGNILQSRGKLEQAETTLRGAIVINPSSSEVHYNLGNILHKLNKLEDAEVCYRKSISLDPEYFEPQNNLGNLLAEMGRFGESEAILTQLITLNSDSSEAYFNLGNTLKNLDRLEESAQCLREALAIKPRYSDARNNLAVILKQLGQYQEAIKHFDLINHPDALAQVLECHYFDANYAAFDQRLNLIAASENTNLRVAAVSAFVAHQRDKQDIYQFCQQPLDFVMTSNLSEYDPHSIELVNNILEESSGYKLAWESRTTKFGFQGPNDLFQNPSEDVFKLEKIVRQAIADYYAKYRNQSNILIESWPTSYKLTAWYNRLLKNGFQMAHLHSGGWISGVIYLKTTAPSNNNEGAIEFSLHGYDYPIINANYPKQLFQPVTGDIVLFPSSLFHRTLPFTTNAERCVIAFDLVAL